MAINPAQVDMWRIYMLYLFSHPEQEVVVSKTWKFLENI